ncbi:homoaconitate hydratase family protein [bacterium]|nr:homoaconitate hydratase family protein [bacterium]
MGQTMMEKIFSNHSTDKSIPVKPGNIVWIGIDYRTARDFGGANVVNNLETNFDGDLIDDTTKTMFTFDTVAPAKTIPYAVNQHRCRQFARKNGIDVHDVDEGIGSHLLIDQFVKPGMTVVGTDSHFNIMGAIASFGQGMGDVDISYIWKSGKTWFEVPGSVKVTFVGKRGPEIRGKDIVLFMLKKFGSRTLLGKSVELYGEEIEKLSLDERITIASMGTEMGTISLLIPVKGLGSPWEETPLVADADAQYDAEYTLNLDELTEPQISAPPYPHNVKNISELAGKEIDTVFIGSCTNGRYSDLKLVADIVKGKRIKCNGFIVPSTREVYGDLLKDGIIMTLFEAGFVVSNPGCGGCASGQIGMTGYGEVIISTSNRNFKGKQGNGEVHLASPELAARSALKGVMSAD